MIRNWEGGGPEIATDFEGRIGFRLQFCGRCSHRSSTCLVCTNSIHRYDDPMDSTMEVHQRISIRIRHRCWSMHRMCCIVGLLERGMEQYGWTIGMVVRPSYPLAKSNDVGNLSELQYCPLAWKIFKMSKKRKYTGERLICGTKSVNIYHGFCPAVDIINHLYNS